MGGRVLQVHVKGKSPDNNGLPKPAVPRLEVGPRGAAGDYNHWRTRVVPEDVDQSILLLTREVIDGFNAEGWPVRPGDFGENITLDGVAESGFRPGVHVTIGPVELEISKACDPCTQLYALPYVGAEQGPAFVKAAHGRRGWYARVVSTGVITPGMPVQVSSGVAVGR